MDPGLSTPAENLILLYIQVFGLLKKRNVTWNGTVFFEYNFLRYEFVLVQQKWVKAILKTITLIMYK